MHTIDPVIPFMLLIEAELKVYNQINDHAGAYANGQAGNVDKAMKLVTQQASPGNG
jgi:hypothetical protein